jgi:hypothetical protein
MVTASIYEVALPRAWVIARRRSEERLSEHAFRSVVASASRLEMARVGSNASSDTRWPSRDGKCDDDVGFPT